MTKPTNPDEEEPLLTAAALGAMADERILDARVLLQGRRWAFAYYNGGYAVECALKVCVLSRMILTGWVFKKKLPDFRVHDLDRLIDLADLRDELNAKLKAEGPFRENWTTVLLWKETSRYVPRDEPDAVRLLDAIDGEGGVLAWLKTFYSTPG